MSGPKVTYSREHPIILSAADAASDTVHTASALFGLDDEQEDLELDKAASEGENRTLLLQEMQSSGTFHTERLVTQPRRSVPYAKKRLK